MNLLNKAVLAALIIASFGCTHVETGRNVFHDSANEERVCVVIMDLSGSFQDLMAKEGVAYEFTIAVIDKYFRDSIGTEDKIIISQVSNTSMSCAIKKLCCHMANRCHNPRSL